MGFCAQLQSFLFPLRADTQVQDHPTAKPDSREAQAGYALLPYCITLHCRLYNITLALHCSGDDSDLWVRPHPLEMSLLSEDLNQQES